MAMSGVHPGNEGQRGEHGGGESRYHEDDEVVVVALLHLLADEHAQQRGQYHRGYGAPRPAEQPAECAVGQTDQQEYQAGRHLRTRDDFPVPFPELCKRHAVVVGLPAQGAEFGVVLERDGKCRNGEHFGVCAACTLSLLHI